MNAYFNNENLIRFIIRKKIIFLIVTIVAIVVSIVFSGPKFITPLYKSSAILYPSNLYTFSDENETEQMLQFLRSDDIILQLIEDFDLYQHYNIPQNAKHAQTLVTKKLKSNLSISKSQYEGVEIKIYDKDPKQAKIMVDSVISYYNKLVKSQHNRKYKEVMSASLFEMNRIKKQVDSLNRKISNLRLSTKVLDAKKQARILKPSNDELYNNFLKNKEQLMILDTVLTNLNHLFVAEKIKYEKAYREYQKDIKYYIWVSKPQVADKKSYPIRWLIVLLSLIGTYIVTFITLSILDKNKEQQN